MGVHTGDSVTVAPAMTLTDREYQTDARPLIAIPREVGVDTGGCNIQFAIDPGRRRHRHRDEPAGVAVLRAGVQGHRLPRSPRWPPSWPSATPSTRSSTTSPNRPRPVSSRRWTTSSSRRHGSRSRSSRADDTLTTTMKSVGEAMSLGRNFIEGARQGPAVAGDQTGGFWTADRRRRFRRRRAPRLRTANRTAGSTTSSTALRWGGVEQVAPAASTRGSSTRSTPRSARMERQLQAAVLDEDLLRRSSSQRTRRIVRSPRCRPPRRLDRRADAAPSGWRPPGVQDGRHLRGRVRGPPVPLLDLRTRSGRRDREVAPRPTSRKVLILRAGPNRIGRGIEFDYCCVHAATTLSAGRDSRPSWSTATRRRCPPTTTPPTGCTSNRSPSRTC